MRFKVNCLWLDQHDATENQSPSHWRLVSQQCQARSEEKLDRVM